MHAIIRVPVEHILMLRSMRVLGVLVVVIAVHQRVAALAALQATI